MQVILDDREHALYEKCMLICKNDSHPYHAPSVTLSKKVLPVGDVAISLGTEEWLVERKSLADLLASIKDGRYEEQSYRLQHACDSRRVMYLIEGVLSTLRSPRERKLVHSVMTSLQVFKGFSVVRTSSVEESAEWIMAMADKIHRDVTQKHKVPVAASLMNPGSYSTVVKRVKKENVTRENMCEIVLCQLPGISHVAATAITQKFPSIVQLVDALRADPHCLALLTTANGRKLGKNVHQTLAEYFMFSPATAATATPAAAVLDPQDPTGDVAKEP